MENEEVIETPITFEPEAEVPQRSQDVPRMENEEIERNLRPFNKPGLMEDTRDIPYRTTRSGARYT